MTSPDLTIRALLPIAPDKAIALFTARAHEIGFSPLPVPGGVEIAMIGGDLRLDAQGGQTLMQVTAQDLPHVQMLRDFLTGELAHAGITPDWQGHRATGRPDNHALVRVVGVDRLSPSYARVTVQGAALARFVTGGLHFSLLFGPKGGDWPTTDANGVTIWPGGAAAWHKPVYTTRQIRAAQGQTLLVFDVFLHEGGRVTDWCARARPGDEIVLSGPAGDKGGRPVGWHGFVGDETALPAIARLLERLPAEARGHAIVTVPEVADIQHLSHPRGARVDWALRGMGATPLSALAAMPIPPDNRNLFFAAAKSEAQAARSALLARGLAKTEFTAAAYWSDTDAPAC